MTRLWLDDIRTPPDDTWTWIKSVAQAKIALLEGQVENASLDHDLGLAFGLGGVCWDCDEGCCDPNTCEHGCHQPAESGSDLVDWMEKNDCWPKNKPAVHSQNPVGRRYMQKVIDKKFHPE